MKLGRLTLAASCAAALSLPAHAADVTMNLGWATPLESDNGIIATKFEELAEKYSDGTIDVKLRCCAQIATEDDAFKAMQLGTVDAYLISQNNISPHWPLMDVFVLPYVFQSTEHLLKVADGEIGQGMKDRLHEETGVTMLTFGGPSYRDFFNSKRPIETMADMDGLKIRVPKNEVMLKTFEAFGAEPVPLAWSETPTALQTGTIDGGDNGTNVIEEMKLYEFAKYLTVLDHFAGFSPMLASQRFMDSLDGAQREAVMKAAAEAGDYQTEQLVPATNDIRQRLVSDGMELTEPDRADFIAAAQGVQEEIAAERGEDFAALVKTIRQAAEQAVEPAVRQGSERVMGVARWLERHFEETICCVALSAVATLVFLQVIMRYAFGTALQWSEELAAIGMVWAVYMGASLRERFHIRIMAGVIALPVALGRIVVFVADASCIVYSIMMLIVGVEYLGVLAKYTSRTPRLGIDEFWPQTIIVIGYALILARLVQIYAVWWREGRTGLPGMRPEHATGV